jgi:DNA replication protein DnaC
MMNSPTMMNNTLPKQLHQIGLRAIAQGLDDFIARSTKQKFSPLQLLEEIVRMESLDKAARNLQRRLSSAHLGRFKPITDFDWAWPKKIDRELIEQALRLEFIAEKRNLIMLGSNGLGKTTIAQNLGYQAALAGRSVLFRTASEVVSDLSCDSPLLRKRKLANYGRVDLLCIDEIGYLTYDAHAADLLYEVVNRRYEKGSIVLTTNRVFTQWNEVFPNATCIATLLDRLLHHADVILIEGESYRVKESQLEAAARRKKRSTQSQVS